MKAFLLMVCLLLLRYGFLLSLLFVRRAQGKYRRRRRRVKLQRHSHSQQWSKRCVLAIVTSNIT